MNKEDYQYNEDEVMPVTDSMVLNKSIELQNPNFGLSNPQQPISGISGRRRRGENFGEPEASKKGDFYFDIQRNLLRCYTSQLYEDGVKLRTIKTQYKKGEYVKFGVDIYQAQADIVDSDPFLTQYNNGKRTKDIILNRYSPDNSGNYTIRISDLTAIPTDILTNIPFTSIPSGPNQTNDGNTIVNNDGIIITQEGLYQVNRGAYFSSGIGDRKVLVLSGTHSDLRQEEGSRCWESYLIGQESCGDGCTNVYGNRRYDIPKIHTPHGSFMTYLKPGDTIKIKLEQKSGGSLVCFANLSCFRLTF